MSGIIGFPTQQKLVQGQKTHKDFATLQPTSDLRNAIDVNARYAFRVNDEVSARVSGAGTGNIDQYGTYVEDTATVAIVGDFVRFQTGNAKYLEFSIVEVDVNGFRIAARMAIPPLPGDTFFVMRYASQRVDSSGAQAVVLTPYIINYKDSARLDYSITNVTTGAWVQIAASTAAAAIKITLFDGGGYAMELGIGAAASETRLLLIPPGGFNGEIDIVVPIASRLSIRAVGAALVNAGEICINLLG